jgi:hypothetical protein
MASRSELRLRVETRSDAFALVVEVDGRRVAAETCVTCPLGLVSALAGPERRRDFTCEGGGAPCASRRQPHAFNVEPSGPDLIWSRTNYPGTSRSVTFDRHQACVAVCAALLELKAAIDADPAGMARCAKMMPGEFTYDDLLRCIERSRRLAAESAP